MTFSYSGDASDSPNDEVRFLLQDTDPTTALLSDEDIAYVLARLAPIYDDALMAAAFCADIIANRYASEVSISADGVSISAEQLQTKYAEMATNLRSTYKNIAGVGGAPYAGGIDAFELPDFSIRPLSFGIGMHDNPYIGSQGTWDRPYNGAEFESSPW